MKKTLGVIMALVMLTLVIPAGATPPASKTSEENTKSLLKSAKMIKNKAQLKSSLGTSFRFDASSLNGKYQSSPSTVATVENDKFLDDLLGVRKNFNDRIKKDKDRN